MGTTVGDSEDFAVKIGSDQEGKSIDLDGDQVTSSDIVGFQYGNPLLLKELEGRMCLFREVTFG